MMHESRRLLHCADEAHDALGILERRLKTYGWRNEEAFAISSKVADMYEEMQALHLDIERIIRETEA